MASTVKLNNGMMMPIVGLGTWQSPTEKVTQAVRVAIDNGYRHIDTAYNYKNEDAIGDALEEYLRDGKVKREDLFIVTKLPGIHMNPKHIRRSVESSLKRLRLDYLDVYLLHTPMGLQLRSDDDIFPRDEHGNFLLDNTTDIVSIWKAMEDLVDAGLTKSIGLSNFNSAQVDKICQVARIQPVTNQVECHLYFPNTELADFCKKRNVTITAYAPIGSPGRPPHLALMQKGIIVIPKSVTPERIIQNFQVFDFEISKEDMNQLDNLQHNERLFKFNFGKDHPEFPFSLPY